MSRRGDARDAEFSDYVASRRSRLLRTAWLLSGDRDLAEDIVQNALTRVYASWSRVRRADSVDAYVRRAVVNAHHNETRRPWRRRERPLEPGHDAPAPTGAAPEESDALWTALRELAPRQRQVVVLRHYWGLSVEETAADLDISPGTVKSQTSVALERLRHLLTAVPDQGGCS
jgi:RNA polymerase sigma-70 factor (sigma-E family)